MKKPLLLFAVLLLVAVLSFGCRAAAETGAQASVAGQTLPSADAQAENTAETPSLEAAPETSPESSAQPSVVPSAAPSAAPSAVDPNGPAQEKNRNDLKKEVEELEDELKELKDLFEDIDFDGINEF